LISNGKLKAGESWIQLRDFETSAPIEAGRGSVYWNEFRQRWVMVTSSKPGEIWFAEGDTPVGPWVYAQRIVSHDNYNFYNPTQHPFFDQEGGRLIYFEGTYTASFSGAKEKTPRYDYNQVMYRLALDDARLNLPVPVYRVQRRDGPTQYLTRESVEPERLWGQIEDVAFFVLPFNRGRGGTIPVFAHTEGGHQVLSDTLPNNGNQPIFFALPATAAQSDDSTPPEDKSPSVVFLYEYRNAQDNRRIYSTNPELADKTLQRSAAPLCRVWRNPMSVLSLDPSASPVPLAK
jgi:hypothetical protein